MPDLLGCGLEGGCPVGRIFLKNRLQWTAAPCTEEDMRRFRAAWTTTRRGSSHGNM